MEKPRKSNVWIVILIIAGLIGSFVVGGLAGGAAGWALGRRAMARAMGAMERTIPERAEEAVPANPEGVPGVGKWFVGGAMITSVVADSPAEEAGLQVGEIITSVDGDTLDGDNELAEIIGRRRPGQMVELTVVSMGGDGRKVRVMLQGTMVDGRERAWLGIEYYSIDIVE